MTLAGGRSPARASDSCSSARICRIDPDDRDTVGDRAADDLCRAADAGRLLAVPDGDQEIDIRQHDETGRLVGARAFVGGAVEVEDGGGARQQLFERRARGWRIEVARVFGARKRQNRFQPEAGRKPGLGEEAVRSFRQRGDDHERVGEARRRARRVRRAGACQHGVAAFDLARRIDDGRENAIEQGAHRRLGFDREFRRQAMPADADAQADAGRQRIKRNAHRAPPVTLDRPSLAIALPMYPYIRTLNLFIWRLNLVEPGGVEPPTS